MDKFPGKCDSLLLKRFLGIFRESKGQYYVIDVPTRSLLLQTGFFYQAFTKSDVSSEDDPEPISDVEAPRSNVSQQLEYILKHEAVDTLNIFEVEIGYSAAHKLSEALGDNCNIRTFFLKNRNIYSLIDFGFLKTNTNLLVVHLAKFRLTEFGCVSLINGLTLNKSIVELHLESIPTPIDESTFWSIFKCVTDANVIRKLSLIAIKDSPSLDVPGDALNSFKQNTSLNYLNLSANKLRLYVFQNFISSAGFIKHFDFSMNSFGSDDADFAPMVDSFAALHSLTSLDISWTMFSFFSERLFKSICDAIAVNKSISSLNLGVIRMKVQSFTYFFSEVIQSLEDNSTLTSLKLDSLSLEYDDVEEDEFDRGIEVINKGIRKILICLKKRANNIISIDCLSRISSDISPPGSTALRVGFPTICNYLGKSAQSIVHLSLSNCGLTSILKGLGFYEVQYCILSPDDKLLKFPDENILDESDLVESDPSIYYAYDIDPSLEVSSFVSTVGDISSDEDLNSAGRNTFIFPNDYSLPVQLDKRDVTRLLSQIRSLQSLNLEGNALEYIDYNLFLLPHLVDLFLRWNRGLRQPPMQYYRFAEEMVCQMDILKRWAIRKLSLQRRSHYRRTYSRPCLREPLSHVGRESEFDSDGDASVSPVIVLKFEPSLFFTISEMMLIDASKGNRQWMKI